MNNVLFLLRLWPVYGGGETVTICLANEMVKRGWNVHVLYFKHHTRENLPFIDTRIKSCCIEEVNCDEFNYSAKNSEVAEEYTVTYIKQHGINCVIDQWWPVEYIKHIKQKTGVKMVKCLHQAFYAPKFEAPGVKTAIKRLFQSLYIPYKKKQVVNKTKSFLPYVDKYVFLSPAFQKQFEEFSKCKDNNQLYSIPNPLVFEDKISEEDFAQKENIVLLVARMVESQKRITVALKAWANIEKRNENWKFVIVGEGPDLNNYKNLAASLNLKNVHFEGFQAPRPYYKKAKIFVMTSYFEGFGMTLVESQQYGVVPVVMDSFLALHDIIDDGYNGLITPNGDVKQYSKVLDSLMNDDVRRCKLAKNGLVTCERFKVTKVVDSWEKLFNSIV